MILPGTVPQDGLSAALGLTRGGILTPLSAPEFLFILDGTPLLSLLLVSGAGTGGRIPGLLNVGPQLVGRPGGVCRAAPILGDGGAASESGLRCARSRSRSRSITTRPAVVGVGGAGEWRDSHTAAYPREHD
jgi:hypothetical protein